MGIGGTLKNLGKAALGGAIGGLGGGMKGVVGGALGGVGGAIAGGGGSSRSPSSVGSMVGDAVKGMSGGASPSGPKRIRTSRSMRGSR